MKKSYVKQVHLEMLSASTNAKKAGDSTVVMLGFAVDVAMKLIKADRNAAIREAQLEGKQEAWNRIWEKWLEGDDDAFDDFMRRYNAELWPPESQSNAKEEE